MDPQSLSQTIIHFVPPLFRPHLRKTIRARRSFPAPRFEELGALQVERGEILLVLLDLMLPDATGMSGIKTVKSLFPEAPICVISSRTDTATVRQALSQDIVGFSPRRSHSTR